MPHDSRDSGRSSDGSRDALLDSLRRRQTRRLLCAGWFGILVFLTLGIVLEAFHGLKVDYYLNVRHETRRLLWTLAHAHGTLFSLICVGWALTVVHLADQRWNRWTARGLLTGMVFVPLGFFLGGLAPRGGDPGPGILLVPVGAGAMFLGLTQGVLSLRPTRS